MKSKLFVLFLISLFFSCKKEDSVVASANVEMRLAVQKLSSAREWLLTDIYVGDKLIFANGLPLDGKKMYKVNEKMSLEFDGILEKAIFGGNGIGKVKYKDTADFEDFKYEIDEARKLLIIKNTTEDELYSIAGGSIQSTKFILLDNTENANLKFIFVAN